MIGFLNFISLFVAVTLSSESVVNVKYGPIHFWFNDTWVNVCNMNFDDVTANLVCNHLGFDDGYARSCSSCSLEHYARGLLSRTREDDIIYIRDASMECDGSQNNTNECLTVVNCAGTYASVVCHNITDKNSPEYGFSFKFKDGEANRGQVVVRHLGIDGIICSNSWTDIEATVFCKSQQDRFQSGVAYHYKDPNVLPSVPFWISSVNCSGDEPTLSQCSFLNRTSIYSCPNGHTASAICFNNTLDIEYRLINPHNKTNATYGRIEMSLDGVWGTVCDQFFTKKEADVVCRQLVGFENGFVIRESYFGPGYGPVWYSRLQCDGSEANLHNCPHTGFKNISNTSYYYRLCQSHRHDTSVYCVNNVMLSLGFGASMGGVEIYRNNSWYTVCSDNFNNSAARVVCRSLGFPYGTSLPGNLFGVNRRPIGFSHIACSGDEPDLDMCVTQMSDVCSESLHYASVSCSKTPIDVEGFSVRLLADRTDGVGRGVSGMLGVRLMGVWGSVCAEGFTGAAVDVACRQLNMSFIGGIEYSVRMSIPTVQEDDNFFGNKPILMSGISCTGNETSLNQCKYHTDGPGACKYYAHRAGVICYQTDEIRFRIVGDNSNSDESVGRVEMSYDGTWGTFCDLNHRGNAGSILCKTLGFKDGAQINSPPYRNHSDISPVWFHKYTCNGAESSITMCANSGFNAPWTEQNSYMSHYCRHGPTSVKCFGRELIITGIRLMEGPDENTGRVEVYLRDADEWGSICDDFWDSRDAQVVCRMLGYTTGKAAYIRRHESLDHRIWMDNVQCTGNETSLNECSFNGFGLHNCQHHEDAGVTCLGNKSKPNMFFSVTTPVVIPTTPTEVTTPMSIVPSTTAKSSNSAEPIIPYDIMDAKQIPRVLVISFPGTPVSVITIPVVSMLCVLFTVLSVVYYRKRQRRRYMGTINEELITPGSSGGHRRIAVIRSSLPFSRFSEPSIKVVLNPVYSHTVAALDAAPPRFASHTMPTLYGSPPEVGSTGSNPCVDFLPGDSSVR